MRLRVKISYVLLINTNNCKTVIAFEVLMITEIIKEHDGDCYQVFLPDYNEFECVCSSIVTKDKATECEVCHGCFCPDCGTQDFKETGWFICCDCQDSSEFIDILIEEIFRLDEKVESLKTLINIFKGVQK